MAAILEVPKTMATPEMRIAMPRPFPKFGIVELADKQLVGTGWLPDLPDLRDYTDDHPSIQPMIDKLGIVKAKKNKMTLPGRVDLRQWCSPVENQGNLFACTANAAVGMVEYLENRAFGRFINGSRLFVYKTTRDLMGMVGDVGAYLRTTMGSLVTFGVPPENYWPYTDRHQPVAVTDRTFDLEPTTFVYEIADNFENTNYICHDPYGMNIAPLNVVNSVKLYLSAGIPTMFGFYVFPSCNQSDIKGGFPYPTPGERAFAGHAVVAMGFDDSLKITNQISKKTTVGAFLLRNSWGTGWGDQGYGWLPYDYVISQFAQDFWSLLGMRWIDTGVFGLHV